MHRFATDGIEASWKTEFDAFFGAEEGNNLLDFLQDRLQAGAVIYPPDPYRVFRLTQPQDVRVVILGQDPYHGPGQAMGMAFSVPAELKKLPPSLKNIFKELEAEFGPAAPHNDLTPWVRQGVLLLNTVLTVEQGAAFSHAGHGWELFTRAALEYAATRGDGPLAALLWGKPAQKYAPIFRAAAHHRPVLVLESAHPSPLSAYRGFFGSAPFGKANAFLQANGTTPIQWFPVAR